MSCGGTRGSGGLTAAAHKDLLLQLIARSNATDEAQVLAAWQRQVNFETQAFGGGLSHV